MENEMYYADLNSDTELDEILHELFIVQGHEDAEIRHPTEGSRIYTKKEYLEHKQKVKVAKMSPADRVRENARLKRIKSGRQIKFRTAMITAKTYTVDIDDDKNFGTDIDGNAIPMEDMAFVAVSDYLPGIVKLDNEIGCFISEDMERAPIRILSQNSPAGGGADNTGKQA